MWFAGPPHSLTSNTSSLLDPMTGNPVGKKKQVWHFPWGFRALRSWLFLTPSPPQARAQEVWIAETAPTHSQITPWWQTAGAGQLTPPSQPPVQEVGPGGRLAPLSLLPPSLLPSLWAQLTSDSGPLKSLLQPTGLGLKPAPPAPGSPAESSPLLPED